MNSTGGGGVGMMAQKPPGMRHINCNISEELL